MTSAATKPTIFRPACCLKSPVVARGPEKCIIVAKMPEFAQRVVADEIHQLPPDLHCIQSAVLAALQKTCVAGIKPGWWCLRPDSTRHGWRRLIATALRGSFSYHAVRKSWRQPWLEPVGSALSTLI